MIKTTTMSTNINPAFNYLLNIDKPVEACASTFVELYNEAIGCISTLIESKKTDMLDIEDMDETFESVLKMMEKLNALCIYQFVDTFSLVEDLRQLYCMLHVPGRDECMAILDNMRGRPQERYSDPDPDLGLPDDVEDPLAFRNPHVDIPKFYTPEFKEYTQEINRRIKDDVESKTDENTTIPEKNRLLKEAIGKATLEFPLYSVHRIFAGIVVPAGHIDHEEEHHEHHPHNHNN